MIYAIIVTYNPDVHILNKQYEFLKRQVECIIYVDNGSSNIDYEFLDQDNIRYINNKKNLGLGYAQNQGINLAISEGASEVILFDQDSVPPKDFVLNLKAVYDEASSKEKIGLVGPMIKNAFAEPDRSKYGVVLTYMNFKYVPLERITKVSYCIASGSLIPVNVMNEVGLIKDKLFIDGMDLEWCLRARSYGYSIIQTNATYLDHRIGEGSTDRILSHSPFREYYIIRNNVWLTRQSYIPLGYRVRKCFTPFVRIFSSIIKGNFEYTKKQITGYIDGFRL